MTYADPMARPVDPAVGGTALDQVGPALSRLRRRTPGGPGDRTRNLVLNLVRDATEPMTVGGLAAEMGVTQPVASRTVAACVAEGLLRRVACQDDARRTVVELTDVGVAEHGRLATEQRATFEDITADWEPSDRVRFAEFLVRYGRDAGAWSARHHRSGR